MRTKFEVEVTGYSPLLPENVVVRLLCHALLEQLPWEALDGVRESIYDAWEWHRRPVLPAPAVESTPVILSRVFDPVEEPPFSLTEE